MDGSEWPMGTSSHGRNLSRQRRACEPGKSKCVAFLYQHQETLVMNIVRDETGNCYWSLGSKELKR
jgi:hypothetical protein